MSIMPVPEHSDAAARGLRNSLKGVVIDCGSAGGTVAAGDVLNVNVTFDYTFLDYPVVVLGHRGSWTLAVGITLFATVHSVTRTGCTIRFYNNSAASRDMNCYWAAIGMV